jgi:prolyl-tRNA synthetase
MVDGHAALVLVPGDREADLDRLAGTLAPATVELFTPEDFEAHPQLARGYVGPQGASERGLTVYADRRVAVGSVWVTGANSVDTHARYVVNGRDFTVDHYLDVATVHQLDPCPKCEEPLELEQAIEIGHIFQLGRKYADAFMLDAAGQDGRPVRVTMGSYGIGVSRAMAAVAEQTHDQAGLCWPAEVAPADVHVVAVGKGDEVWTVAEDLSGQLAAAGWRVILDDRKVAPGVAFADADLLGMGIHVVVGKALADGQLEIKRRRTGERYLVAVAAVVDAVSKELSEQSEQLPGSGPRSHGVNR